MFDFGKKYTLEFYSSKDGQPEIISESDMEVVSSDIPLVKFSRDSQDVVINVSSPAFVRGTRQD